MVAAASFGSAAKSDATHQKRILIISLMTSEQLEAFYSYLGDINEQVDPIARPISLSDSDVVVYFLNNWSSIDEAPGAAELSPVFDVAREVPALAVAFSVDAELADGNTLTLIFYSLEAAGYPSLRCLADHLSFEISRQPGDQQENHALSRCEARP